MKIVFPADRSPRRVRLSLVCALALLAAGCGGGGGGGGSTPPPTANWRILRSVSQPQPVRKWTFLVFVNAANDLEAFSTLNINQMEQVGSTDDVNIVVQVKRISNLYDGGFTDWKDSATRRMLVTRDGDDNHIASAILEQNDAADMGKTETLQEFVRWGVDKFPAERYSLVIWNHGAGWRKVSTAGRGVSYDDTTDSHIDTIDMPEAVRLGGGRKWDLLAFDASLIQMAEVAYEIRNEAQFIVGSEESPNAKGYSYDKILAPLTQNPGMDGRALGEVITRSMLDYYGARSNVTQSLLDASKIGAIAPALNALGRALLDAKATYGAGISDARGDAEQYDYPENKDLIDFVQLLGTPGFGSSTPRVPDAAVLSAAQNVERVVREAIVLNVNGTLHPHSNGLALFVPTPSQYARIDQAQVRGFGQRYTSLAFAHDAPNWQAFLVEGPP